jgi:hypothetical protein
MRQTYKRGTTMKFTLELNCDNEAFKYNCGNEIARILLEIATKAEYIRGPDYGNLRDINGNTVGKWELKEN